MTPTPYSTKPPASAQDSAFIFYDIESLHNVFTVALHRTKDTSTAVYYLIDDDPSGGPINNAAFTAMLTDTAELTKLNARIATANPELNRRRVDAEQTGPLAVAFYDLSQDQYARQLAGELGGINTRENLYTARSCEISGWPIVCDTDPTYDHTQHPFIAGYNSNQYDTTMLALYFSLRFPDHNSVSPVTAATMRHHNDEIFAHAKSIDRPSMPQYLSMNNLYRAGSIRKKWIASGRHLDVARLNELQQRVALKRLLGMLGYQILESEKLAGPHAHLETIDDLIDLISYNISDTVGTGFLFQNPNYAGSFDLRAGLLRTYPETVFDREATNFRVPVEDTTKVLQRPQYRLTTDSSSAQFAGRILAPYRALSDIPNHIADLPIVSFRYPDPLGHTPGPDHGVGKSKNVLTELRDFLFRELSPDTPAGRAAHEAFKKIYDYYRRIEGLNFNTEQDEYPALDAMQSVGRILNKLSATELVRPNTDNENIAAALNSDYVRPQPITDLSNRFQAMFNSPVPPVIPGQPVIPEVRLINFTAAHTLLKEIAAVFTANAEDDTQRLAWRTIMDRLLFVVITKADAAQPYWPEDRLPDNEKTFEWSGDANHYSHSTVSLSSVAKPPGNITYVDKEGNPTSCFVTFSIGGIHGAEANIEGYSREQERDSARWAKFRAVIDTAIKEFSDAAEQVKDGGAAAGLCDEKTEKIIADARAWVPEAATRMPAITRANGVPYHPIDLAAVTWWIRKKIRITIIDPETNEPIEVHQEEMTKAGFKANNPMLRSVPKYHQTQIELFPAKESKALEEGEVIIPPGMDHTENKLNPKFRYTSVGDVIHEDFTSYYPLMLVNLNAFSNPDLAEEGQPPRDKYSEIFADKERYGELMEDPSVSEQDRQRYKVLRNGTKLILNSASGAADARHSTPILMNNMIITMRIIGQLFSFRIGQAQTFAGGKIISTNTDGLYSTLDEETNQKVLDEHTDAINVAIKPEPLTLVSKDSNNRVEFKPAKDKSRPWDRTVASAGGGTLACWEGPNPAKALAHPAMTDRLLVEYFKRIVGGYGSCAIDKPMDRAVMNDIVTALRAKINTPELLRLFQNLIASSPSAPSYLFSAKYHCKDDQVRDPSSDPLQHDDVTLLGHYTRVFMVKPDLLNTTLFGDPVSIATAKARIITTEIEASRSANNTRVIPVADPIAEQLLIDAGEDPALLRTRDVIRARHSGVDPTQPMIVLNESLINNPNPEKLTTLLDALDIDAYINLAVTSFDENWRNYL